jgi:hypothetical protein
VIMMAGASEDITMTAPSKTKKPTVEVAKTQLPAVPGCDIDIAPGLCPGAQKLTGDDSVKHYAIAISKGWQKTVADILAVAKICAEADKKIPSPFRHRLYPLLPFDRTVFSKLVAIGESPALYDPEVGTSLPPNWTTLYVARKLTPDQLKQAITARVLRPSSSREELRQWVIRTFPKAADLPDNAFFRNKAVHAAKVKLLLEAWKASPALVEQWRRAPQAVRTRFIQQIKNL